MWLLSTARAELKFFVSPEDVPGGYAILSHVWLKDSLEDTFQDVQAYAKQCTASVLRNGVVEPSSDPLSHHATDSSIHEDDNHSLSNMSSDPSVSDIATTSKVKSYPTNPRDLVSPKVRAFLTLAEEDGYDWAWVDTCCIDKTSSAELTEVINSMFRYYALSDVCYVYLADVPPECNSSERYNKIKGSEWHRRGWTLQELIASRTVLFVSQTWTVIGDKYRWAPILEKITNVPQSVLRFEEDFMDKSVAERMSWAAGRQTTRIEDQAYCLFGLFGIHLPAMYGEGVNAFYRLQEEILRTSPDTTLFAWGHRYKSDGNGSLTRIMGAIPRVSYASDLYGPYLLAPSLLDFDQEISGKIEYTPNPDIPCFTLTSQGIHAHLQLSHINAQFTVARLSCTMSSRPVWLVLRRSQDARAESWDKLGVLLSEGEPPDMVWSWEDIYIAARPLSRASRTQDPKSLLARLNADTSAPYRIKPSSRLGRHLRLTSAKSLSSPSIGSPVVLLVFEEYPHFVLTLVIGRCEDTQCDPQTDGHAAPGSDTDGPAPTIHYASFRLCTWRNYPDLDDPSTLIRHRCPEDHISSWPDNRTTFKGVAVNPPGYDTDGNIASHMRSGYALAVDIAFKCSPFNPSGETLEFDIQHSRGPILFTHPAHWAATVPPGFESADIEGLEKEDKDRAKVVLDEFVMMPNSSRHHFTVPISKISFSKGS